MPCLMVQQRGNRSDLSQDMSLMKTAVVFACCPTFRVIALIVLLLSCVGCRPKGRQVFSGNVTDQSNKPVAQARVEVNGKETLSKGDGTFELSVPAASRYILNISHPDFADFSYISRTALKGQNWPLIRAQVETVDAKNPITLKDTRPEVTAKGIGSASFTLKADSLVDDGGNAPAGPVRATMATLDVANGEAPGDWAVRSDDGQQEGFLVSYGAVFIQFTDQTGKVRYQLRNGMTGDLSLPVIPSMKNHAPAAPQAGFWYYDTKDGYWKKTGEAGFDLAAGAYTGKIDHLSTINTDIAKFDAACLKITLDPSVAPGLKLRIRYHSGGTPFGQTPILVMNDLENAMFRLPSNTNILVELLDASNAVFGDLVVEDPVGTPVVNNVVNTGPQIPAGHTLWPLPPFTDCHPILLRRLLTQVELRINELPAAPGPRDDPTDDYITWAPTFCLARLSTPAMSDVNIELTNDPPAQFPDGGDVLFAADQSPWPVNTTATAATLPLVLPADGSWVPFVIAGKGPTSLGTFGKPSTDDKDAIIEAHLNNAGGPTVGTKALMVRVRKNANDLKPSERSRFLFAWQKFRNKVGGDNYIQFQEMHRLATMRGDEAHMQPAFLSWHRTMLLHVERELQKLEPSVALHYWNWDAAAPNIFAEDFMGAHGVGGGVKEPLFADTNPLNGWKTDLPFGSGDLQRNTLDHTADPAGAMKALVDLVADWANYGLTSVSPFAVNSFSDDVERSSHNPAHGWPCAGGNVTNPNRSASDPLFYLLHSQIDREWAYWQSAHNRFGVISMGTLTFPAPAHYDNNDNWNTPPNVADADFRQKGSFLQDGLWPWDGTTDGPPGTPETRPPNQAGGPGDVSPAENVPASTPLIPTTAFPASVIRNLWPSAATVPRNAHMIDYLGKFRPQDGLGFSYDDVPY
jgi:tyrosinase